ncbi:MAG: hypothetical protein ACLQB4_19830, partial [Beijerinckiaceae bacterium]
LANQKIDANGIAVDENPSFSGACTCGLVIHLASSPPSRTALRPMGQGARGTVAINIPLMLY